VTGGVKRRITETSYTYTPGYISRGFVTTSIIFFVFIQILRVWEVGRYSAIADYDDSVL